MKKTNHLWYWPAPRYFVDDLIAKPQHAVVRNLNVPHNVEIVAVCDRPRNAARIVAALNREDRFKRGSADAKIAFDYTPRAFVRGSFRDRNGEECSIQESSLATEPCIWLGMDRANICVMSSESHNLPPPKLVLEEGSTENSGWKKYVLPDKVHDFCRMELTQEMALELSGLLLYFAERGTLPAPKAQHGRAKKGGAK